MRLNLLCEKPCSKCKLVKPFKDFHVDKRKRYRITSACKVCNLKVSEKCRAKPGKKKEAIICTADWRKHNRAKVRRSDNLWGENNREKIKHSNRKYRINNKIKIKAHKKVARALIIGELIKLPCHICDDPDSHAHHEDYSKPLEVFWLCVLHHAERHIELRNSKVRL